MTSNEALSQHNPRLAKKEKIVTSGRPTKRKDRSKIQSTEEEVEPERVFVRWDSFQESQETYWADIKAQLRILGVIKRKTRSSWEVEFPALNEGNYKAIFHLDSSWISEFGQERELGHQNTLLTKSMIVEGRKALKVRVESAPSAVDDVPATVYEVTTVVTVTQPEDKILKELDNYLGKEALVPPQNHLGIASLNINGINAEMDLKAAFWLMRRRGINIVAMQDTRIRQEHKDFFGRSWRKLAGEKAYVAFTSTNTQAGIVGGQIILTNELFGSIRRNTWSDASHLGIILEQTFSTAGGIIRILSLYWPVHRGSTVNNNGLEAQLLRWLDTTGRHITVEEYIWEQITARLKRPAKLTILAGDFNQPWSETLQSKLNELHLRNSTMGNSILSSRYSGDRPSGTIDFIVATQVPTRTGGEEHSIWGLHSDHRPIWAWFRTDTGVKTESRPATRKWRPVSRTKQEGKELRTFQSKVAGIDVEHIPEQAQLQHITNQMVRLHRIPLNLHLLRYWSPWLGGVLRWRLMLLQLKNSNCSTQDAHIIAQAQSNIEKIGADGESIWRELNTTPGLSSGKRLSQTLASGDRILTVDTQLKAVQNMMHLRKRKEKWLTQKEVIARRNKEPYLFYKHFSKRQRQLDWSSLKVGNRILTRDSSIAKAIADKYQVVYQVQESFEDDLWEQIQDLEGFRSKLSRGKIPVELEGPIYDALIAPSMVNNRRKVEESLSDEKLMPTLGDFIQAIQQASDRSAGGPSGLTYRTLKDLPLSTKEQLFGIMTRHWHALKFPETLSRKLLFPIEKKARDITDLDNTRPIMLLEVLRKIWGKIIIKKIRHTWESAGILQPNQYGFRSRRSCMHGILPFINGIEEANLTAKQLCGSSWDIKAAFDSVARPLIELALRRLGIPKQFARFLAKIDNEDSVKICIPNTDWGKSGPTITTCRGVGQGDSISPTLWIAFFDIFLTAVNSIPSNFWFPIGEGHLKQVMDSAFADDLLSMAGDMDTLQSKANLISALGVVLDIQFSPTKFRCFTTGTPVKQDLILYDNNWAPTSIECNSNVFIKYLGATIGINGSVREETRIIRSMLDSSLTAYQHKRDIAEHHLLFSQTAVDPKGLYRTQFSHIRDNALDDLSKSLRLHAKRQLHLPPGFPTAILEGPRSHGGLGWRSLKSKTFELKIRILETALQGFQVPQLKNAVMGILTRALRRQGKYLSTEFPSLIDSKGLANSWLEYLPEHLGKGGLVLQGYTGAETNGLDSSIPHHFKKHLPEDWEVEYVGDLMSWNSSGVWRPHTPTLSALCTDSLKIEDTPMMLRPGQKWVWGPSNNQSMVIILGWTRTHVRVEKWTPTTQWIQLRSRFVLCCHEGDLWMAIEDIWTLSSRIITTKATWARGKYTRRIIHQYPAYPSPRPRREAETKVELPSLMVVGTDGSWTREQYLIGYGRPTTGAAVVSIDKRNPSQLVGSIKITNYASDSSTRVYAQEAMALAVATLRYQTVIYSDSKSVLEQLWTRAPARNRLIGLIKELPGYSPFRYKFIESHPEKTTLKSGWTPAQWANHHADTIASKAAMETEHISGAEITSHLIRAAGCWTITNKEGILIDDVRQQAEVLECLHYLQRKQIDPEMYSYGMACHQRISARQKGALTKLILAKFDRDRQHKDGTLPPCQCGCLDTLEDWTTICNREDIKRLRDKALSEVAQLRQELRPELSEQIQSCIADIENSGIWRGYWRPEASAKINRLADSKDVQRHRREGQVIKMITSTLTSHALQMHTAAAVDCCKPKHRVSPQKKKEGITTELSHWQTGTRASQMRSRPKQRKPPSIKPWMEVKGQTKIDSFYPKRGIG